MERKVDADQQKSRRSALFRFLFRLFLGICQWHCLLECLAHFVQTLLFKVMHTLGTFCTQVNQIAVLAHKNQVTVRGCWLKGFKGQRNNALRPDNRPAEIESYLDINP